MCYVGYLNDESSVAKMATEDIKVWKIMDKIGNDFLAPHRSIYVYPDTRLQSSKKLGVEFLDHPPRIIINEGLHAYTFRPGPFWKAVTECYIPKGSVYFANDKVCVSQNLIFDKSYDSDEYSDYYSSNRFKRFFKRKPEPIYIWKD